MKDKILLATIEGFHCHDTLLTSEGQTLCKGQNNWSQIVLIRRFHYNIEKGLQVSSYSSFYRELSKRPTAVCFTRDERSVLIGDKTGEVYLYSLSDWSETGRQHLLGHFSMLLDMVCVIVRIYMCLQSTGGF